MQASYGRILRRAAVPTAAAAVVMIALCAGIGGVKGLIGALLGVALVAVFFGISLVAVGRAARVSPQAMMITAVVTFLVKILALAVLVSNFSGTSAFNSKLFGITAIVCILAWTIGQAFVSSRMKVLYVEPNGELYAEPDGKR
jgi:ATP synthase protein I